MGLLLRVQLLQRRLQSHYRFTQQRLRVQGLPSGEQQPLPRGYFGGRAAQQYRLPYQWPHTTTISWSCGSSSCSDGSSSGGWPLGLHLLPAVLLLLLIAAVDSQCGFGGSEP